MCSQVVPLSPLELWHLCRTRIFNVGMLRVLTAHHLRRRREARWFSVGLLHRASRQQAWLRHRTRLFAAALPALLVRNRGHPDGKPKPNAQAGAAKGASAAASQAKAQKQKQATKSSEKKTKKAAKSGKPKYKQMRWKGLKKVRQAQQQAFQTAAI